MNRKLPSIQLNMLMNVLLTLSSVVFPLITLPYVTRVLGPDAIGKVYFASSVVTTFSIFAEIGIPVYGIRACARVRDDRDKLSQTAGEIVIINLISCAAVYTVFAVLLLAVPKFAENRLLLVIMSSVVILNAVGVEWLYKALEKYTYITVRSLIFKLIALAGMFMLVRDSSDYMIYGALTVFAAAASNILNLINAVRYIDLHRIKNPDLRRHLPAMLMLFAMSSATVIYTNMDLAFLGIIKGDAEAGLYGVPVRIKLVLVNIITSVSAVLLPRVSFYYGKGMTQAFNRLLGAAMNLISLISVPAAVFFVIFADDCIMILAGDAFRGAVLPMRIIIPSIVFIGISNVAGMQILVPMGREDITARAAWIGAAADVALNIILIPRFASAGAAAATLTAEVIITVYLVTAVRRIHGRTGFDIKYGLAAVISSAASAAAGAAVRQAVHPLLTGFTAAGTAFAAVYLMTLWILWKCMKNNINRDHT